MSLFKKYTSIIIISLAFPVFSLGEETNSKGNIKLELSGFKNTVGYMGVLLFKNEKGFPANSEKAYKIFSSTFSSVSPGFNLYDIEYGTYALSVLHDENMNNKMDTNWLGLPKEGSGVSMNAKGRFGPPKYQDALFTLNESSVTLNIEIHYFGR